MRRPSRRTLAILAGLAVLYFAGGGDVIRYARQRYLASLRPPPVVEQGARLPEPPPLQAHLPRERVQGRMWLSDPPRPLTIAVVLTSIVTSALLLMYFTGRGGSRG